MVGRPYQRPLPTPSPSRCTPNRDAPTPGPACRIRIHGRDTAQSIDNIRAVLESSVNAWPEDQTANLNRCLFFITPLISYATPPFYSEFRLDCRECVCVCTCVLRACISVYTSVLTCFSLRREFVTASRLFASRLASSPSSSPSAPPPYLPFFVESTVIYFALCRCTAIRGCIESHRCTCTRCTSSYLLDQFTLGTPF